MAPKLTAARIRKLVANPGTRAALDDKYLPRKHLAERLKNRVLDSPVAPGSDLTNRGLAHDREAATGLRFGEQQSAIDQAVRQSDNTQKALGDWYANYQQQLKALQESDRARQDQVVGQVKAFGEGSAALAAADNSRVHHEQVNDAALRGATPDARLAAQGLQAARSRDSLNAAFGSLQAVQGQAQDRYASGRLANTGLSKIEANLRETANRSGLSEKQRLLDAQKGQFREQYVSDAKQRERKYGLDVQHQNAENTAFNVKSSEDAGRFKAQYGVTPAEAAGMSTDDLLALQMKVAAAKRGPAKPAGPAKVNAHGFTDEQWAGKSVEERRRIIAADKKLGAKPRETKPRSGPGSLAPGKEQQYVSDVRTLAAFFTNPPKVNGKPLSPEQIVQNLQTGANPLKKAFDPRLINAARSFAHNKGKGLGPWGAKNFQNLGGHVNGNFPVIRP